MTKPNIKIHNITTDEIIEREMNTNEFKQYQIDQVANASKLAEAEAKALARQSIADRLGLTADELQVLLG